MRKPKLTFEDHTQLGTQLAVTRDALMEAHLKTMLSLNKNGPIVRKLGKALMMVEEVRSELDDIVCGSPEFRDKTNAECVGVYYPRHR